MPETMKPVAVTMCNGSTLYVELWADTDHEAIRMAYQYPTQPVLSHESGDVFEAPTFSADVWK